ncbi:MAG: BON domain-containing protein [Steroidobacteraceae bacterium]
MTDPSGWGGVAAARTDRTVLLLAMALAAAVLAGRPPALAQAPQFEEPGTPRQEVVVTAQADAAVTAKVTQVLDNDRFVDAGHISVETRDGVVILRGIAMDLGDLNRMLRLARRVAGKRRVVNQIDLIPEDLDTD